MSAEPGTDKAARREKIVMALGIAAVILFSANLLTMIARHFWPDLRFESLFAPGGNAAVSEVDTMEAPDCDRAVHVFVKRHGHEKGTHRFVIGMDARAAYHEAADRIDAELRRDMDQLHRDIARQQMRIRTMNWEADRARRSAEEAAARTGSLLQEEELALDRALGDLEAEMASLQRSIVVRQEKQDR
ncbi:MAG: hypothetical protein HKN17_03695 [Rhodothermales bacterium]|nr:hypothetical protein [Rhodothermales bacterium]